ncbi:MAG: 4'-phosphopantetheinyl transferase family protein [Methanosarcina sp.]
MYTGHLELPPPTPLEDIPHLWEQNDILIFLINLDNYNVLADDVLKTNNILTDNILTNNILTDHLDMAEKEHLESLKTSYFKKRYIVSRIVLKCVLKYVLKDIPGCILKDQCLSDIGTYNDEYGKVHIRTHKELHICISYTGNIVSLAISKVEVGIDIELKKSISPGKVLKYLQTPALKAEDFGNELDFLTAWTLKEAYCKFSNKSMLTSLNKELDLGSVFHSSYILNNKYILSVITDANPHALNISCLSKIGFHGPAEE